MNIKNSYDYIESILQEVFGETDVTHISTSKRFLSNLKSLSKIVDNNALSCSKCLDFNIKILDFTRNLKYMLKKRIGIKKYKRQLKKLQKII
ncbi:hypothetical protein U472_12510 [Orenia metallireducens]|uniref:Uncharacterized protein n=1 Tax=Orenia metallireducens TaxID=1413210 RepID=A0A1C0A501_9FIRM|nr:hypothetical protein [Orenia metallireducens]OCL25186.1 hypothetical protein U472_12510 [Orenia metallireducens]